MKFRNTCHVLDILFKVLFYIIIISAAISAAGIIYIIINYNNLDNLIEELSYLTDMEVEEILSYSKGYIIMLLIDMLVVTGLEAWLYFHISKTARNFYLEPVPFTPNSLKNIKGLVKIFFITAGASFVTMALANITLSPNEAQYFVLDEISLILGFVFMFVGYLFKIVGKPIVSNIEITHDQNNNE